MKIRTFHGTGADGIDEATAKASQWLSGNSEDFVSAHTAMCSVGSDSEIYQSFVITIVYRERAVRPVPRDRTPLDDL
jgi:hypothetical protein